MATSQTTGLKSEYLQKSEHLKELQRLRIQEQNVEKERSCHLFSKQSDTYKDVRDLIELSQQADTSRSNEKQKLQQQLKRIKHSVEKFRRELEHVRPSPEFVEKLKIIMEDIEKEISQFKEQQKNHYDELLLSEHTYTQEIAVINNKIDSWSSLGPPKSDQKPPTKVATDRDITKDLPPQVAAFERFVSHHGGPRGGWDDYDHNTFLKYRNRHKGKATFIRDLIGFLPTKTESEIRHHELWYQQYLDLNDKKKEAIQKWREKKEIEKETILMHVDNSDDEEKNDEKMQQKLDEERQMRKIMLNKWKIDKELQRAEEEQRQLREKEEKAHRAEEEKRKREEQKMLVEEFRQQKEEEKMHEEYMRQMKQQLEQEKRQQATRQVQILQQKAISQVKDKVEKKKRVKREEQERKERLESKLKSQNEVARDPSRLLQPTAGWKHRQNDTKSQGGQIYHMQHRAVPSWRQM